MFSLSFPRTIRGPVLYAKRLSLVKRVLIQKSKHNFETVIILTTALASLSLGFPSISSERDPMLWERVFVGAAVFGVCFCLFVVLLYPRLRKQQRLDMENSRLAMESGNYVASTEPHALIFPVACGQNPHAVLVLATTVYSGVLSLFVLGIAFRLLYGGGLLQ